MARLKHGKLAMPVAKTAWRGVQVYFTDSYASWQKGAIEKTNKLIRHYIPKEMDTSSVLDKKIASIQAKINRRPRKKLNSYTPKEEFFKHYS